MEETLQHLRAALRRYRRSPERMMTCLLGVVALLSALAPALRATRVEPAESLRTECYE